MPLIKKTSKIILSNLLLAVFIFLVDSSAIAQDYSRKSLTILMIRHGDNKPIPPSYYNQLTVSDRHDFNNIGTKEIKLDSYFSQVGSFSQQQLEDKIYADRIPNKILKSILIDESKGYMTVDLVKDRGLYNASDAEYVMAKNSARGVDILKDAGVKLLRNIYFLVIQPNSFSITNNTASKANDHALSGIGYLYQLDLDSVYMSGKFWEDFYFEKSNVAAMKKLMNHRFPLKSTVKHFSVNVSDLDGASTVSSGIQMFANALANKQPTVDERLISRKSESQIFSQLINRAQRDCLTSIESAEDFLVKGSVFKSHPLLAKIGKKEDLKIDKLFSISENVIDKKTGKRVKRHVGYVRAKWVADNRTRTAGGTKPSSFYRIASGKIRKGMEITDASSEDSRFSIGANYNPDSTSLMGGYFLNMEYITHLIPGFNLAIDLGYNASLTTKSVEDLDGNPVSGYLQGEIITSAFTLRQSFSYHRLSVTPLGGLILAYTPIGSGSVLGSGGSPLSSDKIKEDYTKVHGVSFGLLYGVDVGINLTRTIQLRAGYRMTAAADNTYFTDNDNPFEYNAVYGKKTLSFGIRFGRL